MYCGAFAGTTGPGTTPAKSMLVHDFMMLEVRNMMKGSEETDITML